MELRTLELQAHLRSLRAALVYIGPRLRGSPTANARDLVIMDSAMYHLDSASTIGHVLLSATQSMAPVDIRAGGHW